MTPEEIAEIRQDSKTICPTNIAAVSWQAHVRELHEHIDEQAAEIKRLEDALVEERARRLVAAGAECFFRTPIKGSILSKCDKGIYCDWTTCPIKDEKRQDAREQLRAEGVIG